MKDASLVISVGVTGHRDILSAEYDRISADFRALLESLLSRYEHLGIRVMTGLAEGADQLLTRLSLAMRAEGKPITPVAVFPMPLAEYRQDFSGDALGAFDDLHRLLIDEGLPVIELPTAIKRDDCYANLGDYLVNKSDLLAAVWDHRGNVPLKKGGTAFVVGQALDPLRLILRVEKNQDVTALSKHIDGYLFNSDALPVYCISAGRQSTSPYVEAPSAGYVVQNGGQEFSLLDELPAGTSDHFSQLNELALDLDECNPTSDEYLCKNSESYRLRSRDLDRLADNFHKFDGLAICLREKTKFLHKVLAGLTLSMTGVFLVYAKLLSHWAVLFGYIAIFALGYAWYVFSKPNKTKFRYALARLIAESLRIEFFWLASGLIKPCGNDSLARRLPAQGNARGKVVASILKQSSYLGDARFSFSPPEDTLKDWIKEQSIYYKGAEKRLHKIHLRNEKIVKICIFVPMLLCAGVIAFYPILAHAPVFYEFLKPTWKDLFVFLAGFIPVLGAVVELNANNNSIQELFGQYSSARKYLERVENILNDSNDTALALATFEVAGLELSREHMQWLITTERKAIVPAHGG